MGVNDFFDTGKQIFGNLFIIQFMLAVLALGIIMHVCFMLLTENETYSGDTHTKRHEDLTLLSELSAGVGLLQTMISFFKTGLKLMSGEISFGVKAFALITQGFSSSVLGYTVALMIPIWICVVHNRICFEVKNEEQVTHNCHTVIYDNGSVSV